VTAQRKQEMTNFYDIGNPGVGALTLNEVTGGEVRNPQSIYKPLAPPQG